VSNSFTTSNHHQHSRVSSTAVMHSVPLASGLTFEPRAHNVLICVACRSGSQCKQMHNWARMRIVITMMSSCTLHAARPQLRTYGNRRHSGTSISAMPHGPLWCFLAMATLSDADIIRTAVGAAAPPQLHSAKVKY